ncbi:glutathione S-transferase family protein [Agaribacterium haliotis]|uniref:glutathione S-transferase family protein n=1 Tax=Agaribacterium haliotis TaxID=2013869 RepID=UPI000BB54701|nr:glutathione S-transferase N-terminal domain-containing protein [Agaribacterium haliotis]
MNQHFSATKQPIKLYRNPLSGHCHRVELLLSLLDLPYDLIDLDMANGAHKSPEFLALNPFGQVPVIDDNGFTLADSNAIIYYLAQKYAEPNQWLPQDAGEAAQVVRWLSVAAGEVAAGPAAVRLAKLFKVRLDYNLAKQKTEALFQLLEQLFAEHQYLVAERPTLADIAVYTYIAHVQEGAVSLAPYPAIRAWLTRVEQLPRFVGMLRSQELV